MQTKIILTIDTEFSIAGAFANPTNEPLGLQAVLYEKNGKSHGLGYILDTLSQYNLKATFFVETLNVNYFGYEPMGDITHKIAEHGHDIQLHLHPCWNYFKNKNWRQLLKSNPPNDDFSRRNNEEIESLLLEGLAIFSTWGLPKPIALRTGSLNIKKDVYKAMNKVGIKYSSNIGIGIFKPDEMDLHLFSGHHEIENCLEFPVLTYCDFELLSKKHLKLLTITGSSWSETEFLLRSAAKQGMDYLIILTHPSEYIKCADGRCEELYPNRVNKTRLAKLCQFMQENKKEFSMTTFSDLQTENITKTHKNIPLLNVPATLSFGRLIENYVNDSIRQF